MKHLEPWQIIATNALALVLILLAGRWRRGLFLGAFGIYIIILSSTFAYFEGRTSLQDAIAPVLGVILLSADIAGKLPSLDTVRKRLLGKGTKSNTIG